MWVFLYFFMIILSLIDWLIDYRRSLSLKAAFFVVPFHRRFDPGAAISWSNSSPPMSQLASHKACPTTSVVRGWIQISKIRNGTRNWSIESLQLKTEDSRFNIFFNLTSLFPQLWVGRCKLSLTSAGAFNPDVLPDDSGQPRTQDLSEAPLTIVPRRPLASKTRNHTFKLEMKKISNQKQLANVDRLTV